MKKAETGAENARADVELVVPDREMPILDVLSGEQVVVSFVPRGLWFIGAWGRVDAITSARTGILVTVRRNDGTCAWRLATSDDRRQTVPLDRDALVALVFPRQ